MAIIMTKRLMIDIRTKEDKVSGYELLFIWTIIIGTMIIFSCLIKNFICLLLSSLFLVIFNLLVCFVELIKLNREKTQ